MKTYNCFPAGLQMSKTSRSLSSCKKSNLKMAFSKLKYIILSYLVMLWFKTGTETGKETPVAWPAFTNHSHHGLGGYSTAHEWTRLIAAASGALVC